MSQIPGLIVRGIGFGGIPRVVLNGLSPSGAAVEAGPFFVEEWDTFAAGSVKSDRWLAGAVAGGRFLAGAVKGDVRA